MNKLKKILILLSIFTNLFIFCSCFDDEFNKNWNEYDDGNNFIVRYPIDSILIDNVQQWLQPRKEAFNYICKFLDVDWKFGKIYIYVFNDREQGKKYNESELGHANPWRNEIYTLHNQTKGHELVHVVSYYMENGKRIRSAIINEGLATLLNYNSVDFDYYDDIAKDLINNNKIDSCNLKNDTFYDCPDGYAFGASFVKFLIDTFGIELFKDFFTQMKYNEEESFKIFYNKSFEELYSEWLNKLKSNNK